MKRLNQIFVGIICLIAGFSSTVLAQEKKVIAFAQDNLAYTWKRAQIKDLEQRFSKLPDISFIFSDGADQAARQVLNIEDHIYQKVDLLIVSPVDYQAVSIAVDQAHTAGIPVIYAIRRAASENHVSYIHPDDRAIAAQAARFIAASLPDARILMVQGVVTSNTVKNRREGFLEEIKKYDHASVVSIKNGFYTQAGGIAAIDEALSEHLNFNAIYVHSDQMMVGVRLALKKQGIDPGTLLTIGFDYTPEARAAIRSGEQTASMTYPTATEEIVDTSVKVLHHQTVPKEITVPSILITKNNVDSIPSVFE